MRDYDLFKSLGDLKAAPKVGNIPKVIFSTYLDPKIGMLYNKGVILSAIFQLIVISGWSQSYKWAAGIKLSKQMGLSVIYSPEVPYSIEGVISKNLWTNESGLSVIGRYHQKILTRGINFYGGGGLHHGMYEDTERASYTGVILNGGAEMSLGKMNFSFNISPLIAAGSEEMKFRIGSDVTIRRILEKHPRKRNGFFQKLGLAKNKNKKKNQRKSEPPKKGLKGIFQK